ncbi:MAG: hypothetical protein HYT70_02185 [Candidatus Aenigmarchaeota archaeon]|nr:hypothetical protein [Candidatus Aenigmarchaeota archaeon]
MQTEEFIKRKIRKLKRAHPGLDEKQLERELIPLSGEDIGVKTLKKRKRL